MNRSPKISKCLLALVCCMIIFSCNTHKLPKEHYLDRDRAPHRDVTKEKAQQEATKGVDTLAGLKATTPIIDSVRNTGYQTITNMTNSNSQTTVVNKPKNTDEAEAEMTAMQIQIDNSSATLTKELKAELKELDEILLFLNPDSLTKISDSIALEKVTAFCKAKNVDKLTKSESDSIAIVTRAEVKVMIEKKYREFIKTSGDIDLIMKKRDFVIIQEKVLAANRSLKRLALIASSNSYFESGKKTLQEEKEDSLRKYVGRFFDGMFDTLTNIFSPLQNDTIHYTGQLKIYVKGYTDSQGFEYPDSENNNDTLSKRRADYIMKIVQEVYYEKLKQTKFKNVTFLPPIQFAQGYGENYPNENQKSEYEDQGMEDPKRRTAILKFSFAVTSNAPPIVKAKAKG